MTSDVFVSYSQQDSDIVMRICKDLAHNDILFWLDKNKLRLGTLDWENEIREAIKSAKVFLLVASPASMMSRFVTSEIFMAQEWDVPIYPFWIKGDSWVESIIMGLHRVQHLDGRGNKYQNAITELIKALKGSVSPEPANPFQAYREALKYDLGLEVPKEASFATRLKDPASICMPIPYEAQDGTLHDDIWHKLDVDNSGVLLLSGDYGSGKSFIVRRLIVRETDRIPIFYPLKRFHGVRENLILDELLGELHRHGLHSVERAELEQHIADGRLIIVLDGLDEIPLIAFSTDIEKRIHQLIDPLDPSSGNRVIITSRPGVLAGKSLAGISQVRLHGWNMATWKAYLVACEKLGWSYPGGYEAYYRIVADEPSLRELTSIPLYCQMLVETSDRISPPLNVASLYQTYIKKYLDREVDRSMIQDPQVKEDLLVATAQGMLNANQIRFTIPELELALRKHAQHVPKQIVDSFAMRDMTVHSLLVFDRQMKLSFSHQSFYEYFNALGLLRALKDGDFESLGKGVIPMEILDFLANMIDEDLKENLLDLLNSNGLESKRNVALLCLLVKGELSDVKLPRLNLRAISLSGRNIGIVNSNLTRCDLVNANIEGINLSGSDLTQGKLQGCNLNGADLRGANLSFATLRGISCTGTRLEGSKLDNVQIGNEDYSRLMVAIHTEKINYNSDNEWMNYAEMALKKAAGR
jgi:hypothetical protein